MALPRPRLSFRAKILFALVGTVVLIIGASLQAIRHQTHAQILGQVERATESSRRAFAEVEELRNEELERVGERFTRSIRLPAALEASLEEGDPSILAEAARYELALARLQQGLAAFSDPEGREIVILLDGELVPPPRRTAIDPLVVRLLDGAEDRVTGYRLYDGILYSVQVYRLDLFGEPLGALTLGFPLNDEVARRLGEVTGAEVCFVVGQECVAGTPRLREGEIGARFGEIIEAAAPRLTTSAEGRWALMAGPLEGGEGAGVRQVIGVPLDAVLLPFERIQRTERWVGFGALVLAILVGTMLSRGLATPIRTLVAATDRVRRGDYDFEVDVPSTDEVGDLADAFNGMLRDLALKEKYKGVLDKVVSRDIAEEMMKGEIRLGGETRHVTTLFADVRGFTALTEGLESQEIITMLNEWFNVAAGPVEREGGVVDKYSGDGMMAVFGAPIRQTDHAMRAVRAALGMREALADLNRVRGERGSPPLEVGIGVAAGSVVAGNTGSQDRLNYTVLGESVNLASRLCSEAGPGEILVSESVKALWEGVDAVQGPLLRLKGLSYEVRPWIVRGLGRAAPTSGAAPSSDRAPSPDPVPPSDSVSPSDSVPSPESSTTPTGESAGAS